MTHWEKGFYVIFSFNQWFDFHKNVNHKYLPWQLGNSKNPSTHWSHNCPLMLHLQMHIPLSASQTSFSSSQPSMIQPQPVFSFLSFFWMPSSRIDEKFVNLVLGDGSLPWKKVDVVYDCDAKYLFWGCIILFVIFELSLKNAMFVDCLKGGSNFFCRAVSWYFLYNEFELM